MALFFSFDDEKKDLWFLKDENVKVLEMKGISGTCGYCSSHAKEAIRSLLSNEDDMLHYLGNGNYHYLTLFFLEKLESRFDLIVFDHHTDMQESALLPMLSCGSWILYALEDLPLLNKVYIIGPPIESVKEVTYPYRDRVVFIPEENAEDILSIYLSENIYISADLDILSKDEFESVWDQGNMKRNVLMQLIGKLSEKATVLGTDYCG